MVLSETVVDEDYILQMQRYRPQPGASFSNKEEFLEACSGSVVVFAEKMLGFKLYSWQIDFLSRIQDAIEGGHWTKEFAAITSRQIGKSFAVAILALWIAVFNKYPGSGFNNSLIGIVSASDQQAKKLLREIKKLMRTGDEFMRTSYRDNDDAPIFGSDFFSDLIDKNSSNNMQTITFTPYNPEEHGDYLLKDSKSGSIIGSYPPTQVVLGETFSVILIDEAGKTDRITDEFYYEYISPTGSSTDAIFIYTSTPWVSSGFFYQKVDPNGEYKHNNVDRLMFTADAISIENPKQREVIQRTVDSLKADGLFDEVDRAYFCRFVKGENSFFDPEKVKEIFSEDLSMVYSYEGSKCDMGVDFGGRVNSRTVITISTMDDDGNIIRLFHKKYDLQDDLNLIEDIEALMTDFDVDRIIVDDCPQGDYDIQRMERKGLPITRMNFRAEKNKKYSAFRSMVNKNKVFSYEDKKLMEEMHALEYQHKTQQSVIMHAPGYSDDLIDSFLMSSYYYVQDERPSITVLKW